MQNVTRNRIRILLSIVPGLHLRELQRALGVSFNTVRYHVDKLEKNGELQKIEDRRYSRLYPPQINAREAAVLALARSETDRKILSVLIRHGVVTHDQFKSNTGLAKSTISQHLSRLVTLGLLKFQASNGVMNYSLVDPDLVKSLLGREKVGMFDKATGRFIDLWDF